MSIAYRHERRCPLPGTGDFVSLCLNILSQKLEQKKYNSKKIIQKLLSNVNCIFDEHYEEEIQDAEGSVMKLLDSIQSIGSQSKVLLNYKG